MHSDDVRKFEVWRPSAKQKLFRQEDNFRQSSEVAGMMKCCHQERRDHMFYLKHRRSEFIYLIIKSTCLSG